MALGTWQGIYVFEHRSGPQRRSVVLHLHCVDSRLFAAILAYTARSKSPNNPTASLSTKGRNCIMITAQSPRGGSIQ